MRRNLLFAAVVMVSGCTSTPRIVPVASAPPPTAPAAAAFAGYGNLVVPARLADGSFVTPNRSVSAAGAVWHLRAGLNVAALACRGPDEAVLVAGYNAMLQRHHDAFSRAYRAIQAEHGGAAAFDRAMTALYNYYALPPAQPGLCATARAVLADIAQVEPGGITAVAPAALARIDRPYTQVFAAQEAWLAGRTAATGTLVAPVAVAGVAAPRVEPRAEPRAELRAAPRIAIDPAVLRTE